MSRLPKPGEVTEEMFDVYKMFCEIDWLVEETENDPEAENITRSVIYRAKSRAGDIRRAVKSAGVPWKAPHLTSPEGEICFEWAKDSPRRRLIISVDAEGICHAVGAPGMRVFWGGCTHPTESELVEVWKWFSGEANIIEALGDSIEVSEDIAGGVPVIRGTRVTVARLLAELSEDRRVSEFNNDLEIFDGQVWKVLARMADWFSQPRTTGSERRNEEEGVSENR